MPYVSMATSTHSREVGGDGLNSLVVELYREMVMNQDEARLAALLERHKAFWLHGDGGEPLVRVRGNAQRVLFEHVDVTPDMLDVDVLTGQAAGRYRESCLVQGDVLRVECAFYQIPWLEAIVGCEIYAGGGEAMWPRARLRPNYEGMEGIVPGDDNAWLVKLRELIRGLVAANDGSYVVTHGLQRGPIDVLSGVLGDERMGLALCDEPEMVEKVLQRVTEAFIKVARAQYAEMPAFRGGWVCMQYGVWAPGKVMRVQTDSSCQVSEAMYREQILPHEREIMQSFDYSVMDLHSGATLRLYEVLLEVDELDAISVALDPGPNAPEVEEMIPIFGEILESKSLMISGKLRAGQLERLRTALPSGCFCIGAVVV